MLLKGKETKRNKGVEKRVKKARGEGGGLRRENETPNLAIFLQSHNFNLLRNQGIEKRKREKKGGGGGGGIFLFFFFCCIFIKQKIYSQCYHLDLGWMEDRTKFGATMPFRVFQVCFLFPFCFYRRRIRDFRVYLFFALSYLFHYLWVILLRVQIS